MMKKYFLVAAITLVSLLTFVNCSDDDETPVVSIEKSEYTMSPTGSVTVRLTIQNHNGSDLKVPFTLSGTAVKDEHYTVSASEFVFSGGSNSAELVFQAKDNYEESRTIELQLGALPAGFSMGNVAKTTITVQPKDDIVFTFQKRKVSLFSEANILVKMGTPSSGSYIAEKDMIIPIVVETEGTTAVEGEHFEFVGEKAVTIAKGKSEGTISLKWLKTEEGKNSIKLGVGPDLLPGMVPGQNINVTVTIVGPVAGTLQGKWAAKAMVNYDWFVLNTGSNENFEQYPLPTDVSENDIIEITTDEEGTPVLKTSLQGVLKNYFRDCVLTYKNEVKERLQEESGFPQVDILLVDLEKANVSFSATNENIREAEIGFRTFEREGKTILEVTLRDFEPTDFLQNTFNMVKEWGDNPMMKYFPLRYHFVKVD